MALRLDKYLTDAGIGTRSEVKKLIKAKQITVNGTIVNRPEEKVDEENDVVCLRGESVRYASFEYYLFHKPAGCVSATEDGRHRTVMDYLTDTARNDLFPVGRLDLDTEGLLLITNDGALAHDLLSPARHIEKTYFAKIRGKVTQKDINLFENGVDIGEKKLTRPGRLVILDVYGEAEDGGTISEITLTITEGKFHQVKRMFAAVGKEVLYLKRLSMGSLVLPEDLRPGEYRALSGEEVAMLKNRKQEEYDE